MTTSSTEIITDPVKVSTIITLGASDLTGLMVQRHLDALEAEETNIKLERKNLWAELELACAERNTLVKKAYDKKKPLIDAFLTAYAAILPGKFGKLKARPILPPPDKFVLNMFGGVLNTRNGYGIYIDPMTYEYNEKTCKNWDSHWIMAPKGYRGYSEPVDNLARDASDEKEGDDNEDDESMLGVFNDTFSNPEFTLLRIKVPVEWRKRITVVVRRMAVLDKRLEEMVSLRKNMPDLERKVAAAMTERFLKDQPDLVRHINDALNATGSNLLLG